MTNSICNITVELNPYQVGSMMFLLQNSIKKLRKVIINPIYSKDLVESIKKSLAVDISAYLEISKKEELDF